MAERVKPITSLTKLIHPNGIRAKEKRKAIVKKLE